MNDAIGFDRSTISTSPKTKINNSGCRKGFPDCLGAAHPTDTPSEGMPIASMVEPDSVPAEDPTRRELFGL